MSPTSYRTAPPRDVACPFAKVLSNFIVFAMFCQLFYLRFLKVFYFFYARSRSVAEPLSFSPTQGNFHSAEDIP